MLTLAILLQLLGLILTFSLGVTGYFVGPALIIAGGLLYRQEQRRLKALRENPAPASQPAPPTQQTAAAQPAPSARPAIPRRPGWQRFAIVVGCIAITISALIAVVFKEIHGAGLYGERQSIELVCASR